MKIVAIDDEPPALSIIEQFCHKLKLSDIHTFYNLEEAYEFLNNNEIDLLLLDVQMPAINGLSFYQSLQHKPMVIFTTAFANYAVDGFDLNALDYILKPFSFERFERAIQKAVDYQKYLNHLKDSEQKVIFIRADYSLVKIELDQISYIEGLDDYIKIHQLNKPTVVARCTMKGILEKLPSSQFIRIHRSYIVAKSQVIAIKNKTIKIADKELPIGSSYEASIHILES